MHAAYHGRMEITLNGAAHPVREGASLEELVAQLQLTGRFAIERNGQIVPRSRYGETRLAEGDRLEIVQAIGGG